MRRFFLLLLICFSLASFGQDTTKYYSSTDYGWKWKRGYFTASLKLPSDTSGNQINQLASINGVPYIRTATKWLAIGGTDTASLSLRVDQRVKYIDTASMLSPYLRSSLAASIFQPVGSYATTSQNALKLNISDTAGMLINYRHWLAGYYKAIDTTSTLATKANVNAARDSVMNFAAAAYVPYTGATANVNLGSRTFTTTGAVSTGTLSATLLTFSHTATATSSNQTFNSFGGSYTNASGVGDILAPFKVTPTLIATANGQSKVGFRITPTFTDGAFTGQINYALAVDGNTLNNGYTVTNYTAASPVYAGQAISGSIGLEVKRTPSSLANSNYNSAIQGIFTAPSGAVAGFLTAGVSGVLSLDNAQYSHSTGMIWSGAIGRVRLTNGATATRVAGLQAQLEGTASGTTITDYYGVLLSSTGVSGTVTNNWGVYAEQGAKNYFAGKVFVGSNTDGGYQFDVTGSTRLAGAVSFKYSVATDANYSVASTDNTIELPTITANRTVTNPTASGNTGRRLTLINRNSTAFTWTFASAITLSDGTTTTAIPNGTTVLMSNGTVWIKSN